MIMEFLIMSCLCSKSISLPVIEEPLGIIEYVANRLKLRRLNVGIGSKYKTKSCVTYCFLEIFG